MRPATFGNARRTYLGPCDACVHSISHGGNGLRLGGNGDGRRVGDGYCRLGCDGDGWHVGGDGGHPDLARTCAPLATWRRRTSAPEPVGRRAPSARRRSPRSRSRRGAPLSRARRRRREHAPLVGLGTRMLLGPALHTTRPAPAHVGALACSSDAHLTSSALRATARRSSAAVSMSSRAEIVRESPHGSGVPGDARTRAAGWRVGRTCSSWRSWTRAQRACDRGVAQWSGAPASASPSEPTDFQRSSRPAALESPHHFRARFHVATSARRRLLLLHCTLPMR